EQQSLAVLVAPVDAAEQGRGVQLGEAPAALVVDVGADEGERQAANAAAAQRIFHAAGQAEAGAVVADLGGAAFVLGGESHFLQPGAALGGLHARRLLGLGAHHRPAGGGQAVEAAARIVGQELVVEFSEAGLI